MFDVLHVDGRATGQLPLRLRKQLLKGPLDYRDPVRFTPHRNQDGEQLLADACRRGWEGLIAKDATAPYRHGRTMSWQKLKCSARQELVVGGLPAPHGERTGFGALLVGYFEGDRLVYAGKVGTGFDQASLHDLGATLRSLAQEASPFDTRAPEDEVTWVAPRLVVEVGFTEWTDAGRQRHPRFLGLRKDKDPEAVVRLRPDDRGPLCHPRPHGSPGGDPDRLA